MSKGPRVYVGNLPPDVREREIEDVFRKYGKIMSLDLRNKKGPPFAFIDFDDSRDAEDAVHGRDGYELDGYRIRVEFPRSYRDGPRGGDRGGRFGDRDSRNGRNGFGDRRMGGGSGGRDGGRGGGNLRRSKYRVTVSGLPPSGSWQDLKDHMREAGDVCYADVNKDGTGCCEFMRYEDMKYAVKKLDDTKFRSHEGETAYIRIKADVSSKGSRSRSRSASPAARSRSRSPRRVSPGANGAEETAGNGTDRESKRAHSASRSRSRTPTPRSKSRTPVSRSPSRERE